MRPDGVVWCVVCGVFLVCDLIDGCMQAHRALRTRIPGARMGRLVVRHVCVMTGIVVLLYVERILFIRLIG